MKKLFPIIVLFILSFLSSAQIIHHEFDPPLTLTVYESGGVDTAVYMALDLNDDSIADFNFRMSYWYHFVTPHLDEAFSSGVKSFNGSKVGKVEIMYPCDALFLGLSDTISSTLQFDSTATSMLDIPPDLSCGPAGTPYYLPIELNMENKVHFGWILLKTSTMHYGYEPYSQASLVIYDYAYNSMPDEGIFAGDTVSTLPHSGIESPDSKDLVTIYPVPSRDRIIIESPVIFNTIELYDSYGNRVNMVQNSVKQMQIDMTGLPAGLYFLKLYSDRKFVIRRVIKSH